MKFKKFTSIFLLVFSFLLTAQSTFASGPVVGPIVWKNTIGPSSGADVNVGDGMAEVGFTFNSATGSYGSATSEAVIDVQNIKSISFNYEFFTTCYDHMGDNHWVNLQIYLEGYGPLFYGYWYTPRVDESDNNSGYLTINLADGIVYETDDYGRLLEVSTNPLLTPYTGKVRISVEVDSSETYNSGYGGWTLARGSFSNISFN